MNEVIVMGSKNLWFFFLLNSIAAIECQYTWLPLTSYEWCRYFLSIKEFFPLTKYHFFIRIYPEADEILNEWMNVRNVINNVMIDVIQNLFNTFQEIWNIIEISFRLYKIPYYVPDKTLLVYERYFHQMWHRLVLVTYHRFDFKPRFHTHLYYYVPLASMLLP